MQQQFTSNDVIALTGITARQLQWWDERGIVAPGRKGHRRVYSWDELVTVAVSDTDRTLPLYTVVAGATDMLVEDFDAGGEAPYS